MVVTEVVDVGMVNVVVKVEKSIRVVVVRTSFEIVLVNISTV